MYNQHNLIDALEIVLTWDLPDAALTDAINIQVSQNLNFDNEDVLESYSIRSLTFNH